MTHPMESAYNDDNIKYEEPFLAQIVTDLDQEWGCRLVDQEFIKEFMEHKEDDDYKRAGIDMKSWDFRGGLRWDC